MEDSEAAADNTAVDTPSQLSNGQTGLRASITGRWRLWKEQRHARAAARAELKDFERFCIAQPQLKGEERYLAWVMARGALTDVQARRVINQAESSFAAWPENTDLRFVHVLQYLVISEYMAKHPESAGTAADMAKVIGEEIPHRY